MIGRNDPAKSIVASAKRVKLGNRTKKIGEDWQEPLWDIYENLGAVHYGMNFKRSAAQRVAFFVAELPEEDVDEPIPSDNVQANEALDRLGDMGEIVGEFVVQTNVAGEGYLLGTEDEDTEMWEVLSTVEVNQRRRPGNQDEAKIADDDFLLRIWRPSPRIHSHADSPLRSVQAQCEQLLLLNEQIGATAMSRIPAGLLAVASEFSFAASPDEAPDTGGNAANDPFTGELIEYLTAAIKDPGSAARIAPGILRGPAELINTGIKYFDFGRDMDATFAQMREELIRQIANGIDLPAEILTGLADLNHWSLWGIEESTAKHHIDPDVLQILAGLTTGYLRPTLEESGMGKEQASRFVIWRDYSDLTSRPLSMEQAERFFDKSVITAEQLKQVANVANEEDVIGPGDIAVRAEAVGVLFRAGFEPEAILAALGIPSIEHTGVAPVTVQSEKEVDNTDTPIPAGPDNVEPGPPVTAAAGIKLDRLADIDQSLAAQIIEASEAAFQRVLERAGAKVRTRVKKDRQLSALIDGQANEEVTKLVGQARLEQFQLSADQLIPADAFKQLEQRLERLLAQGWTQVTEEMEPYVESMFVTEAEVTEDRKSAIDAFILALFAIAAARLFNTAPAPDPADTGEFSDSIATGQMVFELLTTAGGGGAVKEFTETTPRGFALGLRVRAALRDSGYVTESHTWRYGIAPRRTFEPHKALNGRTVTSFEASDLRVPSSYPVKSKDGKTRDASLAWLGVTHYFPGDHKGCCCSWVPTVLPTEQVE